MPEPLCVVSSQKIDREEFMQFLQKFDGYSEDPDRIYDAQLSNSAGYFWIEYEPEEELSGEELETKNKNILQKLGSLPQTEILLDIGKSRESKQLAAEFIGKFAEKWSCAIDALPAIYSVPEFLELCRQGKNF